MEGNKFSLSVIVPVYNGEKTIYSCLESIKNAQINVPYEVIIVNDGSIDKTEEIIRDFKFKYIKLNRKSGVGNARNLGARNSRGNIIFFVDADIVLLPDTILRILGHFQLDCDADIIQGHWEEASFNRGFGPEFLGLKFYYNRLPIIREGKRTLCANLETGCLAIKRHCFLKSGGFNAAYKDSGGEEHELGYRLLSSYNIYYYNDIFVKHNFRNIIEYLPLIYRRSVNFSILAFKYGKIRLHKFSAPVSDRITMIIIFLIIIDMIIAPVFNKILLALPFFLTLYFMNYFNFFKFLLYRRGLFFSVRGIGADSLIMLPRIFGYISGFIIFYLLRKKNFAL